MKRENRGFNILGSTVLLFWIVVILLPLFFLVSSSFASETSLVREGYRLLPKELSLEAYNYIMKNARMFVKATGISFLITIVGTVVHVMMASMLAYPLSRPDMPMRRIITFLVIFTILFNGGLVPTYLIYTQIFKIKNTIAALIVPSLLMNGFNIILLKQFFTNSIPNEIIEAARIDGEGEIGIYFRIVVPLSKSMFVTIGLMCGMAYWNDWNNGLIYITDDKKLGLQSVLNRIISNSSFLQQNNIMNTDYSVLPVETAKMAVAVLAAAPILVLYLCLQRYFVAGMMAGAVKG